MTQTRLLAEAFAYSNDCGGGRVERKRREKKGGQGRRERKAVLPLPPLLHLFLLVLSTSPVAVQAETSPSTRRVLRRNKRRDDKSKSSRQWSQVPRERVGETPLPTKNVRPCCSPGLRFLVGSEGRVDTTTLMTTTTATTTATRATKAAAENRGNEELMNNKKRKKKKKNKKENMKENTTTTTSAPTRTSSTPATSDVLISEVGLGDLSRPTVHSSSSLESPLLPWTLTSISAGVTGKYHSCADFEFDLTSAANFLAERIIRRNAEWGRRDDSDTGGPAFAPPEKAAAAMAADSVPSKEITSASDAAGESSYGTNNQVDGADEPDVVKSDGRNVYAAYGDKIMVWDAITGLSVSETIVPAPVYANFGCEGPDKPWVKKEPQFQTFLGTKQELKTKHVGSIKNEKHKRRLTLVDKGHSLTEQMSDHDASVTTANYADVKASPPRLEAATDGSARRTSIVATPCTDPPRPYVRSLLLHDNRLTAFVGGYPIDNDDESDIDYATATILHDYDRTMVNVYDTTSFVNITDVDGTTTRSEMLLISKWTLPGRYLDARAIGSTVHAVSATTITAWNSMVRPFYRFNTRYDNMTKEQYIESATQFATDKVVPSFVRSLLTELGRRRDEGGTMLSCADILPLAVHQSGQLDPTSNHWWDNGILSGFIDVSTFDVATLSSPPSSLSSSDDKLTYRAITVFVPNPWSVTIHATINKLFLGTMGYDEHDQLGYIESTYIYEFDLPTTGGVTEQNNTIEPARAVSVGKVAGTLLNQFSMDYYDSHLRVATTTPARWGCVDVAEPASNVTVAAERRRCEWQMIRGPRNHVTILASVGTDGNGGGVLLPTGQTPHLGKPDESITAVRFIGELGFVVTFERRDPFIVLDLSNTTSPAVLGDLDVPGWSSYLHPTGVADKLLAVGQNADPVTGRPTSLQVSLFGFADKSRPELLARTSVEKDNGGSAGGNAERYSSSDVEWNHKAFRYLPRSKVALLPVTIYVVGGLSTTRDFFDGFYVFDIDMDHVPPTIIKQFEVNLASRSEDDSKEQEGGSRKCFYAGYIPARSLVFDGSATLMKGHGAKSVNLQTQEENWDLYFDEDLSDDQCWGYFGA